MLGIQVQVVLAKDEFIPGINFRTIRKDEDNPEKGLDTWYGVTDYDGLIELKKRKEKGLIKDVKVFFVY